MKKVTFVVFLLLTTNGFAGTLAESLLSIESEWANIYYRTPVHQQKQAFEKLYDYTSQVAQQYPNKAEVITWQAIIKATNAGHMDGLSALNAIYEARDLLNIAIELDRETLNGSALVTLATLYYMAPGWPIAFGDQAKAEQLLLSALKINPNGIDTNYFYADYLLSQDRAKEAEIYFNRAINAPKREQQLYADLQLQNEALKGLERTQQRKVNHAKNLFISLFQTASTN